MENTQKVQKEQKKKLVKKDTVFIIVMALIVANLSYSLMRMLGVITQQLDNLTLYAIILAHIIAIIGSLWLVRSYRLSIRLAKENETEANKETK